MSGILNKIENALGGNKSTHTGVPEGTVGPHSSRAANAADPRIDSDLDSSRGHMGSHNNAHHGVTGTSSSTTTPHNSSMMNKLDPRVDTTSTTGRYANTDAGIVGAATHSSTHAGHTHTGNHNTGTHHSGTVGSGTTGSTTAPHNSSLMNKLDPRVDTTSTTGRYANTDAGVVGAATHSSTHGGHTHTGNHHTGTVGSNTSGSTTTPHNSSMMNKLDPRVDTTSTTGRMANTDAGVIDSVTHNNHSTGGHHTGNHHTGTTHTSGSTTTPHSSSLLNKLDPRVDTSSTTGRMANTNAGVIDSATHNSRF